MVDCSNNFNAGVGKFGDIMARQQHLSRAPITEALIDIQVTPREGLTFAALRTAIEEREFGYYVKNPIAQGVFDFKITSDGQQPETSAQSELVGLRLHSPDEKYVAQCRLTGFTLSRLPPYEEWDKLVKEAKRVWEVYLERLAPVRVTRIATRFINNLQLPLQQGGSYQTYLNKLADVPKEAPQAVAGFFHRFELIDVESTAQVNLTLALVANATIQDGSLPVILDVDAFMGSDMEPTDPKLWEILERLRELKNRTFFSTITESAAEMYQ